MVKLTPEQQEDFTADYPAIFVPGEGWLGKKWLDECALESSKKRNPEDSAVRSLDQRCAEISREAIRRRKIARFYLAAERVFCKLAMNASGSAGLTITE